MNHRDRTTGSIGIVAVRIACGVAGCGLVGTAIAGLQSAAASQTASLLANSLLASVAAAADVRLDWADVTRPAAGSVQVPVGSLRAGAVVSTEPVRLGGGSVTGLLFDPDQLSLAVDASAARGRYLVTVHVLSGGVAVCPRVRQFQMR